MCSPSKFAITVHCARCEQPLSVRDAGAGDEATLQIYVESTHRCLKMMALSEQIDVGVVGTIYG